MKIKHFVEKFNCMSFDPDRSRGRASFEFFVKQNARIFGLFGARK